MTKPELRGLRAIRWGFTLSVIALMFVIAALYVKTQDDKCAQRHEMAVRGTFGRFVCVNGDIP